MSERSAEIKEDSSKAIESLAESSSPVTLPPQLRPETVLSALLTIPDGTGRMIFLTALCYAALC